MREASRQQLHRSITREDGEPGARARVCPSRQAAGGAHCVPLESSGSGWLAELTCPQLWLLSHAILGEFKLLFHLLLQQFTSAAGALVDIEPCAVRGVSVRYRCGTLYRNLKQKRSLGGIYYPSTTEHGSMQRQPCTTLQASGHDALARCCFDCLTKTYWRATYSWRATIFAAASAVLTFADGGGDDGSSASRRRGVNKPLKNCILRAPLALCRWRQSQEIVSGGVECLAAGVQIA